MKWGFEVRVGESRLVTVGCGGFEVIGMVDLGWLRLVDVVLRLGFENARER